MRIALHRNIASSTPYTVGGMIGEAVEPAETMSTPMITRFPPSVTSGSEGDTLAAPGLVEATESTLLVLSRYLCVCPGTLPADLKSEDEEQAPSTTRSPTAEVTVTVTVVVELAVPTAVFEQLLALVKVSTPSENPVSVPERVDTTLFAPVAGFSKHQASMREFEPLLVAFSSVIDVPP